MQRPAGYDSHNTNKDCVETFCVMIHIIDLRQADKMVYFKLFVSDRVRRFVVVGYD